MYTNISINTLTNYVVGSNHKYNKIMNQSEYVYSGNLGLYNTPTVLKKLKEGATPKYCKPRPIPYALRKKVEEEAQRKIARQAKKRRNRWGEMD